LQLLLVQFPLVVKLGLPEFGARFKFLEGVTYLYAPLFERTRRLHPSSHEG